MQRRHVVLACAALPGLNLLAPAALAQNWPSRPIKLIVSFPPGGLIDNMARLIAPGWRRSWGSRSSSTTSRVPVATLARARSRARRRMATPC